MELNIDKCHLIISIRSRNPIQHVYNMGGRPLGVVLQIKDLGVILDEQLAHVPHISLAVSKYLEMLGFIKRCAKDFLNTSSINFLYCYLVRP